MQTIPVTNSSFTATNALNKTTSCKYLIEFSGHKPSTNPVPLTVRCGAARGLSACIPIPV